MVHVINIDVIDTPEDATLGAFMLCELAQKVRSISQKTKFPYDLFLFRWKQ